MESTNIVLCGCGPTGALLSVLLSQASVPHVVLEKDLEVNEDPRGIALDEDGVRCLQACGIYDKIFTEIGQCEWASIRLQKKEQESMMAFKACFNTDANDDNLLQAWGSSSLLEATITT